MKSDKISILFIMAGVKNLEHFQKKMKKLPKAKPDTRLDASSIQKWIFGVSKNKIHDLHIGSPSDKAVTTLQELLNLDDKWNSIRYDRIKKYIIDYGELEGKNSIQDVTLSDVLDTAISTYQFIEFSGLRYGEIIRLRFRDDPFDNKFDIEQHIKDHPDEPVRLSKIARDVWSKQYEAVPFVQDLITRHDSCEFSQKVLDNLSGTYYLYRHHSTFPGLLCEVVEIGERRYGHREGTYYQFKPWGTTEKSTAVKISIFCSGFYLVVCGMRPATDPDIRDTDGGNIFNTSPELVSMQIISRPLHFKYRKKNIPDGKFYSGIYSGIYDIGKSLLSERILLEAVSDDQIKNIREKVGQIYEDNPAYHRVKQAISNELTGRVLATSQQRLSGELITEI